MANILEDDVLPPPPTLWAKIWTFMRRQPLGTAGLLLVVIFVLMAVFADLITTHDPESGQFYDQFTRPMSVSDAGEVFYMLGADEFGRDVFHPHHLRCAHRPLRRHRLRPGRLDRRPGPGRPPRPISAAGSTRSCSASWTS